MGIWLVTHEQWKPLIGLFFFFNARAPPEIYPLSLPAALPICRGRAATRRAHASHQADRQQPLRVLGQGGPLLQRHRTSRARWGPGGGPVDRPARSHWPDRSEEHTSELQSQSNLVCRLLLENKK